MQLGALLNANGICISIFKTLKETLIQVETLAKNETKK